MRELIVELAKDLDIKGIGVYDTDNPASRTIFVGEMPASCVEGILLVSSPSPAPHEYIDTEYPVIDFWSRSPSTVNAMSLLRLVYDNYHRRSHYDYDNWHIYFSRALGNIVDVDRDRDGGKLFRLSIQFISRNLNNIS